MKSLLSLAKNTKRAIGFSFNFAPFITASVFVLAITTSLAPLLQSKILGDVVNQIISQLSKGGSESVVVYLVFIYALVWAGTRVLNALQLYMEKIWSLENEQGLDLTMLKKRAEIDLGHYENPDFQNLLQRVSNRSIWPVYEMIDSQFKVFANLSVIIVSSIITSAISWQLYLVVIISAIPSFLVQLKYGYKIWGIWAERSERQRRFAVTRWHIMNRTGVVQAKLFQNSKKLLEIVTDILHSFKKDLLKEDKTRFYLQSIAYVIGAAGFGFSMWLITKDVMSGLISVGAMVFLVSILGQLVGAINSFLAQIATLLEKNLYVTDIFTVFDTKPFIKRSDNPKKLNLESPPTIEFRNVSFKYEKMKDLVLKNINLTINSGEKIALVGMNGAGKTTLIKLLSRIYDPTEGDIFINGINLKEIDLDEWGSYLSVLLQDYLAYDMKVSESIGMGRADKSIDMSEIQEAAGYSGANEFIEQWENKYEQQLGKEFEGGVEPSKGQGQKIALARAIYRNGFIMVLDEPTASIDALSETKIFEQMEKAVKNNTLIVITHRFNTTQNLDKIVVIEHGTIQETGTHKELIAKGGLYKSMFESQAKTFRK